MANPNTHTHTLTVRVRADGAVRVVQAPATAPRAPGASYLSKTAKSTTPFAGGWFGRKDESTARAGHGDLARETRFGRRGSETIREFGAVCDEICGRNAVFLTCTLPGTGDAQYKAIAQWSSYIVQRFTQWWRDNVPGVMFAWCWEWQRRGALHLHAVVASNSGRGLDVVLVKWKEECRAVLQDVSERAGLNLFENTETGANHWNSDVINMDAQWVEKSAARYLAKYLGKRKEPGISTAYYAPARWWSVSNNALAEIRRRRRVITFESATRDRIENVLAEVIEEMAPRAVLLQTYKNRVFTWLDNFLLYHETPAEARLSFNRAMWRVRAKLVEWGAFTEPPRVVA